MLHFYTNGSHPSVTACSMNGGTTVRDKVPRSTVIITVKYITGWHNFLPKPAPDPTVPTEGRHRERIACERDENTPVSSGQCTVSGSANQKWSVRVMALTPSATHAPTWRVGSLLTSRRKQQRRLATEMIANPNRDHASAEEPLQIKSKVGTQEKHTMKAGEITEADDALVKRIRGDVEEYAERAASLEESCEVIKQFYSCLSQEKEKESKQEETPLHSPELVFIYIMEAAVSRNNQPSYGQLLARCLNEKDLKSPAPNGFNEFRAAFQQSNGGQDQKPLALLVSLIKLLACECPFIIVNVVFQFTGLPNEYRDRFPQMSFAEFDEGLKGIVKKALEEEKLDGLGEDGPKNLYEFLTQQS
uniref:MIF4G domain-containing protein n=1 Tax=Steinernema glaseri TaxID=37863 RepID=A0A1I7YYJ3_9BILA